MNFIVLNNRLTIRGVARGGQGGQVPPSAKRTPRMDFTTSVLAGSGSARHGTVCPPKPKILATPLTMNLQLTLLLAYDVFPVILQNLRPFEVLFSKETVCEKFQIAREKWWWLYMLPPSDTKLRLYIQLYSTRLPTSYEATLQSKKP